MALTNVFFESELSIPLLLATIARYANGINSSRTLCYSVNDPQESLPILPVETIKF